MDILKDSLLYFAFGLVFAYPLIWLLNFMVRSRVLRKGKNLFSFILALIIGTWFYNFNFSPSEKSTVEVLKMWYPNAKDIKIMSLSQHEFDDNTYQANVIFSFNSFTSCESIITIKKPKGKSFYDYTSKGYNCK